MAVNKIKIGFLIVATAFSIYVGNIYFKTLSPPDHIHSRDDVPQNNTGQNVTAQDISNLEKRVKEEQDNLLLWLQLGHAYINIQDYAKAEELFREGSQRWPDNAEMLVDWGVALRGLERYSEAQTVYVNATQKFPEYGDGWLQLAVLYRFDLKDRQKALQYFEKYLTLEEEGETAARVRQEIKRIKNEMQ